MGQILALASISIAQEGHSLVRMTRTLGLQPIQKPTHPGPGSLFPFCRCHFYCRFVNHFDSLGGCRRLYLFIIVFCALLFFLGGPRLSLLLRLLPFPLTLQGDRIFSCHALLCPFLLVTQRSFPFRGSLRFSLLGIRVDWLDARGGWLFLLGLGKVNFANHL